MNRVTVLPVLLLLLAARAFGAATTVLDVYVDMENSTDGAPVTTNMLNACTAGSGGRWVTSANPMTAFKVATRYEQQIRGPVRVGSTDYFDTNGATRTLMFTNTTDREFARYIFNAPHSRVSIGMYVRLQGFSGSTTDFYDIFALEANTGEFLVLSFEDHSPLQWRVHTQQSPGTGPAITVSDAKTYWVTALWDKASALATIRVYDPATWQPVGQSTLAVAAVDATSFYFGRYDAHGQTFTGQWYFDDLMMDLDGGTWPILPVGGTNVAPGLTVADFNTAYTNALPGDAFAMDTIKLPAGSNEWTSGYTIGKTVRIVGSGSNYNGTVLQLNGSSQDSIFRVTAPFVDVSQLYLRGVYQANSGWLLRFSANWCKAHECHFTQALSATIMDSFGLVYNCSFLNCTRMGRSFGPGSGQSNWDNYSPVNFGGTNWAVWEDNRYAIDGDMDASLSPQLVLSSQQGALWIVRNCRFQMANFDYAPVFDSHGETDPGLRGNIGVQVYGNTFTFSGTSGWDKFVDIRGGAALVYSNTVTGASSSSGVYMREKDGETANFLNDPVTSTYIWANTMDGSSMPAVVESNDTGLIAPGVNYFTSALSPLVSVPYPHPLRTGAGLGPRPNQVLGLRVIP